MQLSVNAWRKDMVNRGLIGAFMVRLSRRARLWGVWWAWRCVVVAMVLYVSVSAMTPVHAERKPGPVVVELSVLPGVERSRLEIVSVGKIAPQVYQVAGPDRLVIDACDITFRLPRTGVAANGGPIRDVRYGQLDDRRARIVADIGPGTTVRSVSNEQLRGDLYRVRIDLGVQGGRGAGLATAGLAGGGAAAAGESGVNVARRPVVVIDPGHGGIDPGAVVNRQRLEKMIVLAVGRKVRKLLYDAGEVDVVLTRDKDVYLTLDQRIERSRQAEADLFISLHADAVEEGTPVLAVGGASVYVLSRQASDREARRLAEKENAADRFAGILSTRSDDDGVRNILVDLLKRETEKESSRLRSLLVEEMRRHVAMAHNPGRSAAFHVLKQTETPAALIELGYMTNPVDLGLMRQDVWRDRAAKAIVRAVHRFFRERR
jgi:N-acetylmuramoyl-L-alanine amidase